MDPMLQTPKDNQPKPGTETNPPTTENLSDESVATAPAPSAQPGTTVGPSMGPVSGSTGSNETIANKPVQPNPDVSLHKHGKTPVVAIVVALIIALGLAGLTVFAYMKNKNSVKPEYDATTQQPTVAKTTPATTSDVDATTKEVDTTLQEIDNAEDFADASLTDATLGL